MTLDVSGLGTRRAMTIENLLQYFQRKEGTALADDQLLLG